MAPRTETGRITKCHRDSSQMALLAIILLPVVALARETAGTLPSWWIPKVPTVAIPGEPLNLIGGTCMRFQDHVIRSTQQAVMAIGLELVHRESR